MRRKYKLKRAITSVFLYFLCLIQIWKKIELFVFYELFCRDKYDKKFLCISCISRPRVVILSTCNFRAISFGPDQTKLDSYLTCSACNDDMIFCRAGASG